MRLIIAILFPVLIFSQDLKDYWVEWNGEWTTPMQRDFANWCYGYGEAESDRGHTLVWLAKNESSWNTAVDGDDGRSIGPFQIDSTTALWAAKKMGLDILPKDIRAVLEHDREIAADIALWYFEYWYDKHFETVNHKGLAWTHAIASYRYGYRWEKADDEWIAKANEWVRFFKTIY